MTKKLSTVALLTTLIFSTFASANAAMMEMEMNGGVMVGWALMVPNLNIVENAVNADNVTTVVAAVKAAWLVDTLMSEGPFTVFAPTNDAFAKLPSGTVETLLKTENLAKLQDILTYHVVAGKYTSADLKDGTELTTVEGQKLKFTKDSKGKLWINWSAMIETKDVISSNGVTHVIDTVLMPETGVMVGGALMVPNLNIVENAMNADNVTTVVAAVKAAGLVDTLMGDGPFTVFAPTNDAFAKLPDGTVETLLKTENKGTLQGILTYHVVAGKLTAKDLKDGKVLTTVQWEKLYVSNIDGKIWINGAMIETKDVISSNGVTHVIDMVMLPLSTLDANSVFKIKAESKFAAKLAKFSQKQKENLSSKLDDFWMKAQDNSKYSTQMKATLKARVEILKDIIWANVDMEAMMDAMMN